MITKLDTATSVIESLPDPPKKHDMQQTGHCVQAISTLEAHFRKRDDVLVSGNGYLIVSTGSVPALGDSTSTATASSPSESNRKPSSPGTDT